MTKVGVRTCGSVGRRSLVANVLSPASSASRLCLPVYEQRVAQLLDHASPIEAASHLQIQEVSNRLLIVLAQLRSHLCDGICFHSIWPIRCGGESRSRRHQHEPARFVPASRPQDPTRSGHPTTNPAKSSDSKSAPTSSAATMPAQQEYFDPGSKRSARDPEDQPRSGGTDRAALPPEPSHTRTLSPHPCRSRTRSGPLPLTSTYNCGHLGDPVSRGANTALNASTKLSTCRPPYVQLKGVTRSRALSRRYGRRADRDNTKSSVE